VYSRTPGALAQHFGTLHELSGGRAIAGLGTSSAKVIEGFHGVRFQPAVTRLRETTELLRSYLDGSKVEFHGRVFDVSGFNLRIPLPPQPVPIMHGTLNPKSVRMTAETADGWLPIWVPLDALRREVDQIRDWRTAAGKDWESFTVRSPGDTFVVKDPERAQQIRQERRERLAFFVARNGDFYYEQFQRHGLDDVARKIRQAWASSGGDAATEVVSDELIHRFDFVGDIGECRARLEEQEQLGVNLHQVFFPDLEPNEAAEAARKLME
jgi:alkanesulfonate monooxygenase SsuD/methylene tetrahydromethanopterin reductase-like flavin-dependent oxidoreductase (luciferase family)